MKISSQLGVNGFKIFYPATKETFLPPRRVGDFPEQQLFKRPFRGFKANQVFTPLTKPIKSNFTNVIATHKRAQTGFRHQHEAFLVSPLHDGLFCGLILAPLTALSKVVITDVLIFCRRKKTKSEVDGWLKGQQNLPAEGKKNIKVAEQKQTDGGFVQ